MTIKSKILFTPEQRLEYAKLMVDKGYSNKKVQEISGAGASAVKRLKKQYQQELSGITPKTTPNY
ncbi:hypothetical protein CJF42_25340 [Pseudoalteromonas sp. NBT06-2]|uniref:hypothetical protein n=1 Tax=Pseudoalteromonas sp. NBT06-2 TaxID=2025950 RepID=UPI000BA5D779|nr:hypothetical protein [Pseudoalteromonas sp. NBT06-2]PAJ71696.1 hypothetical protein CJF42_25340 [Pseudoalteromonas sp. NBT06-2]